MYDRVLCLQIYSPFNGKFSLQSHIQRSEPRAVKSPIFLLQLFIYMHTFVLYINQNELNRIKPRLEKFNTTLTDIEYFLGVNGKQEKNTTKLSAGTYGHVCSFIKIIKEAISKQYDKILILEPDVYFAIDFETKFNKMLSDTSAHKLVYLGASQGRYYKDNTWDGIRYATGYYYCYKTLGTFGVILDKSIFEEYLKLLERFTESSDVCLIKIQEKYPNECIVMNPNLVCCNVVHSTTSDRVNKVVQADIMRLYKWNPELYELMDTVTFGTTKGGLYEITFNVNSSFKGYSLKIGDLVIREIKLLKLLSKDHKIYIMAGGDSISVSTDKLILTDVKIKPVEKTLMTVDKTALSRINTSDLGQHYAKLLRSN
jgi:hypothetical protein